MCSSDLVYWVSASLSECLSVRFFCLFVGLSVRLSFRLFVHGLANDLTVQLYYSYYFSTTAFNSIVNSFSRSRMSWEEIYGKKTDHTHLEHIVRGLRDENLLEFVEVHKQPI